MTVNDEVEMIMSNFIYPNGRVMFQGIESIKYNEKEKMIQVRTFSGDIFQDNRLLEKEQADKVILQMLEKIDDYLMNR